VVEAGERTVISGIGSGEQNAAPPGDPRRDSVDGPAQHGEVDAHVPALKEALERVLRASPDAAEAIVALAPRTSKPDVIEMVDSALDLSGGGVASLLGRLESLTREEAEGVLAVLADLLVHGVVGYEYREVNGEPYKVYLSASLGSDIHRAPPVRGREFDGFF